MKSWIPLHRILELPCGGGTSKTRSGGEAGQVRWIHWAPEFHRYHRHHKVYGWARDGGEYPISGCAVLARNMGSWKCRYTEIPLTPTRTWTSAPTTNSTISWVSSARYTTIVTTLSQRKRMQQKRLPMGTMLLVHAATRVGPLREWGSSGTNGSWKEPEDEQEGQYS